MRTQIDEILRVMRESEGHMRADEVFLACRQRGLTTSLATVYRNLNIMADRKIIGRFGVPDGSDIFDVTPAEHAHMICDECGAVCDADLGDLRAEFEKRLGAILSYDLTIHCICPSCLGKKQ